MRSTIPVSFFLSFFQRSVQNCIDRSFHLFQTVTWSDPLRAARHLTRRESVASQLRLVFYGVRVSPPLHHPLCLAPCSYLPLFLAAITPVEKMPYRGKLRLLGRACLAFGNACGKSESNPCFAVASIAGSRNFSVSRALDMR